MFHSRRHLHIHFVGIGGIGMSGIAEVLLTLGYRVSGSDLRASESIERLRRLGAHIFLGHHPEQLGPADVVVVSSAVQNENPEVLAARQRGIPVIPRAQMLAELMRMKYSIAVAGSHGKTTTTSLIATVLGHAGLDPTAVVGGKLNALGSNARLGQSEYLVAEADESDGSFLRLMPTLAVVTNIDPEHLDHYGSFAALEQAFFDFIEKLPFYGLAVLCQDHAATRALMARLDRRHASYGLSEQADYRAAEVRFEQLQSRFIAYARGQRLGEVVLPMPGLHNVSNALAVLAVADFLDIPFAIYREALADFQGVGRRFSVCGQARGVLVIDDYGHHPAEIRATLAAARAAFGRERRLLVAFQPHRYSRTRDLFDEFAGAFSDADHLVLLDIYAAGEPPLEGINAAALGQAIAAHPQAPAQVHHAQTRGQAQALLAHLSQPGDIVLTLGAGDITQLGPELLAALGPSERASHGG